MSKKRKKGVGLAGAARTGAGGARKKWGTKNVLHSPFALSFPPALAGSADAVCAVVRAAFPTPPLLRPPLQRPPVEDSDDRSSSSEAADAKMGDNPAGVGPGADDPATAAAPPAAAELAGAGGEAKASAPRRPAGMLFGMNEVTRGLERGIVRLVVAARDVSPPVLIAHLPALCYMKDAELVPFSGGGGDVASIFGVKRLMAFALVNPADVPEGRDRELVRQLADGLRPHASDLDFPWLAAARGKAAPPGLPEPRLAPANKLL
jgi:hypothetical protein